MFSRSIYIPAVCLFILSSILSQNLLASDLVNLKTGAEQYITIPTIHNGEQYMVSFKYKYESLTEDPVFLGPVIMELNKQTGSFDGLLKDDPRAPEIINNIEALMNQIVMSGRSKYTGRGTQNTQDNNADDNSAANNSSAVTLLDVNANSSSTTTNNPGNNATANNGSLVNVTAVPPAQNSGNIELPNGQPIYTSAFTAQKIKDGRISKEDLKPSDYQAFSHSVEINEDGSRTVTVVVPIDQRSSTTQSLITQIAANPVRHISTANRQLTCTSLTINVNGTRSTQIDREKGTKTVVRTYFAQ